MIPAQKENLALEVCGVAKRYGDVIALRGIDLAVRQGQFFGMLGPNGAGKTTLIGSVVGLVRLDEGSIVVFGHDNRCQALAARALIGLSPQEVNLDRFFSIRQILEFQGGYYGMGWRTRRRHADELLSHFGLTEKAHLPYYRLSGGMQKRLLIARAMMSRPRLLILDEPTAGVDVEQRHALWDYLRGLNSDGTTIILTTHYIDEAEELCDTVAIVDQGQVCELGSPASLIAKYCQTKIDIALARALSEEERALFGPEVRYEAGVLKSQGPPGLIAQELLRIVTSLPDMAVRDIHVDRGSLEEVFLKTTGSHLM